MPKKSLFDRYTGISKGELAIFDKMDQSLRRTVRIAELSNTNLAHKKSIFLFEPHIVWMQEKRFVLAGFERVQGADRVVDYAQSWLCMTELPPTPEQRR
ncbi:hypothetical protein QN372_00910 [Undibacterium sp. RTI2.1]|uniref:hypothetical protein n=1 Tax=unclassified Undibacterium TaxID=2630295 RepID=UPI002B2281F9|nr:MULTISPECIES: hypothetical protein [unclassified Undibacterium]MEB0029299.1 hypothetical protein [Undibacterium sp. RTI2.1]MEB0115607.1 hypothetical protein [Undibacterium sp. RTI2.2]